MLTPRVCPVVSLSRRTDMPAFFPGRCNEIFDGNAFRAAVFWSKNPEPLYKYLIDMPPTWYLQYTINDYENEGYEPHIPPLQTRIETLQTIADTFDATRCVWRFDPLFIVHNQITYGDIIAKFAAIADQLNGCIDQCVVSYIDLYGHVAARVPAAVRRPNVAEIMELEKAFAHIAQRNHFALTYCAEPTNTPTMFPPSRCIDYRRLFAINAMQSTPDTELNEYLLRYMDAPDPSQRSRCHCNPSVDLGEYGTCRHACAYCYAQKQSVPDQQVGLGAF